MHDSCQYEVSIIIVSYNPDYEKLMSSVKAAVNQQGVCFEIIISDDGSKEDYFSRIEEYFSHINFKDYLFVKNKDNVGTVKNCLNALRRSRAEYVYFNSPGDYIFDSKTILDFYQFAKREHSDICFGDYVPYCYQNSIKYYENILPKNIMVYDKGIENYKIIFLLGDGICGASYFRSKSIALKSFEYIAQYSKYVEDGTSTAYALVNNIPVHYYKRNIVWYEYGDGISTCHSEKWEKRINADFSNTYKALIEDYPKERVLKAALFYINNKTLDNWKKRFIIRYPIFAIKKWLLRSDSSNRVKVLNNEKKYLEELVNVDK